MKKLLIVIVIVFLNVLSTQAYDFEIDGIYYNLLSENRVEVTSSYSYATYSGSVVIPAMVTYNGTNYNVTSIGYEAFYHCGGLTSVTIPESVTAIGNSAFAWCSDLRSVTLPNSITSIGAECFFYSALQSMKLPKNVTTIGQQAFCGCDLRSVTIPESVDSIGMAAFDCTPLLSVEWNARNCLQGDGVFSPLHGGRGYVREITFGNQVVHLPGGLLSGLPYLSSLTIPESVTTIGRYFFSGCNLGEVTSLAKNPPICDKTGGSIDTYRTTLYVPYGCKAAYESAFEWNKFKNIKEKGQVTVLINNANMGHVSGGGLYVLGDEITLGAWPRGRLYEFVEWDDGNTENRRILSVTGDTTLTAIFAKKVSTVNEAELLVAPFVYVQGRTAYLADGLGEVEAFTITGLRVYRGLNRAVTLPRPGVYVLRVVADGRRCKVVVR